MNERKGVDPPAINQVIPSKNFSARRKQKQTKQSQGSKQCDTEQQSRAVTLTYEKAVAVAKQTARVAAANFILKFCLVGNPRVSREYNENKSECPSRQANREIPDRRPWWRRPVVVVVAKSSFRRIHVQISIGEG
jgi:hypothetical protein